MNTNYDIIVVGGGHAGAEAATIAAKMGSKVLLITMDLNKIAQMSCNPAMGGIAKGQIVREIDALGGLSGYVADETMIQFRMLNQSKGPAMWSPRTQNDRVLFSQVWRQKIEKIDNLYLWQDTVTKLIIENKTVKGVCTNWGLKFTAKSTILTAGTFLNGVLHLGTNTIDGGRDGDKASYFITEQLKEYGITTAKMKTGTPPRIDGRSINFSALEEQKDNYEDGKFSFDPNSKQKLKSKPCFIVHTNSKSHNELKKGFKFSPLFSGTIKGIGPRYCPSIEDKLVTFSDKDSHLLFLEPEGINTNEYYLNGFSSSLPFNVQLQALKKINGFENVVLYKPAYAIEYNYFDPTQLNPALESKYINNLFFAGQVNGTTGYEEAAAQGLLAGINAHLKNLNENPIVLARNSSYIGVLINDLTTKGVNEPYRMFTSRAEHRILLRQDNADERLSPIAIQLQTLSSNRIIEFKNKYKLITQIETYLNKHKLNLNTANNSKLTTKTNTLKESTTLSKLLLRPELSINDLIDSSNELKRYISTINANHEHLHCAQTRIKYQTYIEREKLTINKINKHKNILLPESLDYNKINSISTEAKQKLIKIKPKNINEASNIPGVTPSDIHTLLLFIGR